MDIGLIEQQQRRYCARSQSSYKRTVETNRTHFQRVKDIDWSTLGFSVQCGLNFFLHRHSVLFEHATLPDYTPLLLYVLFLFTSISRSFLRFFFFHSASIESRAGEIFSPYWTCPPVGLFTA